MVSYIKTQWWRLLCAVLCFGAAIYFALQPAPDTSTLEGVNEVTGYMLSSVCWLLSAGFWYFTSLINYNDDRIKLLEKEKERNDAMYELVQELLEANKVDRQYADHLNRKIESFITDYKKKEKQK